MDHMLCDVQSFLLGLFLGFDVEVVSNVIDLYEVTFLNGIDGVLNCVHTVFHSIDVAGAIWKVDYRYLLLVWSR